MEHRGFLLVEATLCLLSLFLVLVALWCGDVQHVADIFSLVAVFLVGGALLGLVERLDLLLKDFVDRLDDALYVIYLLARFETSEAGDTEAYMMLEEYIRKYEREVMHR